MLPLCWQVLGGSERQIWPDRQQQKMAKLHNAYTLHIDPILTAIELMSSHSAICAPLHLPQKVRPP